MEITLSGLGILIDYSNMMIWRS